MDSASGRATRITCAEEETSSTCSREETKGEEEPRSRFATEGDAPSESLATVPSRENRGARLTEAPTTSLLSRRGVGDAIAELPGRGLTGRISGRS